MDKYIGWGLDAGVAARIVDVARAQRAELERFILVHDIAKHTCMSILPRNAEKRRRTPVEWAAWLEMSGATGSAQRLEAAVDSLGIEAISFFQPGGRGVGTREHGHVGSLDLADLGVTDELLVAAVDKHMVLHQFSGLNVRMFLRAGFGALWWQPPDLLFLVACVFADSAASLRENLAPTFEDVNGFHDTAFAVLTARHVLWTAFGAADGAALWAAVLDGGHELHRLMRAHPRFEGKPQSAGVVAGRVQKLVQGSMPAAIAADGTHEVISAWLVSEDAQRGDGEAVQHGQDHEKPVFSDA